MGLFLALETFLGYFLDLMLSQASRIIVEHQSKTVREADDLGQEGGGAGGNW